MTMWNPISSSNKALLVFLISVLLVSAHVINAQNNSNNTNTSNVNSTSNNNTNVNANSNTNSNAIQNTNDTKGGNDQSAKTTPSPDTRARLVESTWYPLVVSLLFGVVLIGFAATIMRVILRSKSSFRSPLGLPDGSLRAMLAFMLVAFLGFYVYASILNLSEFKLPESLLGIIATVIGFYFGSRSAEAAGTATSGRPGSVEGTVVDNNNSPAPGATIVLSQGTNKKFTQTADLNGKFDFDNVPIGDYEVQASLTGHNPSDSAKVKVTAGGTEKVNLKLKP